MVRTQVIQILPDGRTTVHIANHLTITQEDSLLIVQDAMKNPALAEKVRSIVGSDKERLVFVEAKEKTPEERKAEFVASLRMLAAEYARPSERDVLTRIIKRAEKRLCLSSSGPKT